ncbi:hypothetical protein FB451DRAFT_1404648 [Mycena latifolia]|nr:hypothetical protein FB451DRAFT_1404648 [Mycena latifolia]
MHAIHLHHSPRFSPLPDYIRLRWRELSEALHAVDMCLLPPNAPHPQVFSHIISSSSVETFPTTRESHGGLARHTDKFIAPLMLYCGSTTRPCLVTRGRTVPDLHPGLARHVVRVLERLGVPRNAKALVRDAERSEGGMRARKVQRVRSFQVGHARRTRAFSRRRCSFDIEARAHPRS